MHRWLCVCLVLGTALSCGSTYHETCVPVLQSVVALQGRLADVQRARAELAASGIREVLPPSQQAVYDRAVVMLDEGYAVAVQASALAADACSEPDVRGALDLIVKAWDLVVPFLALVGGRGTVDVAAPLVWSEARR